MSSRVWEAFESGDLSSFEKLLSECANKGQILHSGPNPIPCQAAAKGQTEFLRGPLHHANRKRAFYFAPQTRFVYY
jgi:hypothetical protein